MTSTPAVALTIAGSDSGGGAGVQADLTTFAALGVHGTSALTAVTVQDTTGVHDIHLVPAHIVVAQVRTVLDDLPVRAVKTGMLGDAQTVHAVAALAAAGLLPNLVVDPVMVATSGHRLASDAAALALRDLLAHAQLVTPNGDEAAALLGTDVATGLDDQVDQARALLGLGPAAVVVTGGVDGRDRVDVFVTQSGMVHLRGPAVDTTNDHGTGCTFAAAATAELARGAEVRAAVNTAHELVRAALRQAAPWRMGHGRGPVSHVAAGYPAYPTTSAHPTRRN